MKFNEIIFDNEKPLDEIWFVWWHLKEPFQHRLDQPPIKRKSNSILTLNFMVEMVVFDEWI